MAETGIFSKLVELKTVHKSKNYLFKLFMLKELYMYKYILRTTDYKKNQTASRRGNLGGGKPGIIHIFIIIQCVPLS